MGRLYDETGDGRSEDGGRGRVIPQSAVALGRKYQVELPIIEQVNEVLFADKPAKEAVKDLMLRDKKSEHEKLDWE